MRNTRKTVFMVLFSLLAVADPWKPVIQMASAKFVDFQWQRGKEQLPALSGDLKAVVTQYPQSLFFDLSVEFAVVAPPPGSVLGGIGGSLYLIRPGVAPENLTGKSPMHVGLSSTGFFFTRAEGNKLQVFFYDLSVTPKRIVPVPGANRSLSQVSNRFGQAIRYSFEDRTAFVHEGGVKTPYHLDGTVGQSRWTAEKLSPFEKEALLKQFLAEDVTERVRLGQLVPEGHDPELVKEIERTLSSNSTRNVVLRADEGVDTNDTIYSFAKGIVENRFPRTLDPEWIVLDLPWTQLDSNGDVGNTTSRVNTLVELTQQKKVVLFIRDLQRLVNLGSGDAATGNDAAAALSRSVNSGKLLILGTTPNGPNGIGRLRSSPGFFKAFRDLAVEEPRGAKLLAMAETRANNLLKRHRVNFSKILPRLIEMVDQRLPNEKQPGKTLRAMEAIAQKLEVVDPNAPVFQVSKAEVRSYLSLAAGSKVAGGRDSIEGIKEFLAHYDNQPSEKNPKHGINTFWVGQSYAKGVIRQALSRMTEERQTRRESLTRTGVEALLFLGSSGVGKSFAPGEIKRLLAQYGVHWPVYQINGELFKDSATLRTLYGSNPAFTGYQPEGASLYAFIKDNPESIIVIDEFDKMHSEVIQGLYSLLEYGVVTDLNTNNSARMTRGFIILTSNFGASEASHLLDDYARSNEKFKAEAFFTNSNPDLAKITESQLVSSLLNDTKDRQNGVFQQIHGRIGDDNVVIFHHFSRGEVASLIDIELANIRENYLFAYDADVVIHLEVREFLLNAVWDSDKAESVFRRGARVVINAVKARVRSPMALFAIAHGDNAENETWHVEIDGGSIKVTSRPRGAK